MSIMQSTVHAKGGNMNEKIYSTMKSTGAGSIVIGILAIVVGVSIGVLTIINGARLLIHKKELIF